MYTIGILSGSVDRSFEYSVEINNKYFPVKNSDDLERTICEGEDDNIGLQVVVKYEPQDQFCEVIPFDKVIQAMEHMVKINDRFFA
jgi:hypothetical protein